MIEWHTDELRPKHDTILTVEPQKVIVTHDYFQQGDLLMFAGSGCRGYVVLPPVKRANGHTELSIATKYVREITQRTIGWETIWVDSPGTIDEWDNVVPGYYTEQPIIEQLPIPHYEVVNLTPGMTVVNIGATYTENQGPTQ